MLFKLMSMKGNSWKDISEVFHNDKYIRIQSVLVNKRRSIWNVERNLQILALCGKLEWPVVETVGNYKLIPRTFINNHEKPVLCICKQTDHIICVKSGKCIMSPSSGFVFQTRLCCHYCMTYRSTSVECSPSCPDELDINELINEFQTSTKAYEGCESELISKTTIVTSKVFTKKNKKFNFAVATYNFSVLAEEACFNDKLIKDFCLRQVQYSKCKKRMSYTKYLCSEN